MLAERDVNGGSPTLDMAARSGSKDVLEHVLSLIRREFSENKVRCHFIPRTGHATQQTTITGGLTQDKIILSYITPNDQLTPQTFHTVKKTLLSLAKIDTLPSLCYICPFSEHSILMYQWSNLSG